MSGFANLPTESDVREADGSGRGGRELPAGLGGGETQPGSGGCGSNDHGATGTASSSELVDTQRQTSERDLRSESGEAGRDTQTERGYANAGDSDGTGPPERTRNRGFIQQLLLQALTPIFDPQFSEHSYGFRPGRSAQDAVEAAQEYAQEGKDWVVDIDITKFFDHVNHDTIACVPHPDGPDRTSDWGQAGVAFDWELPAAGSDGGRVGGSQRGRNAARRTAVTVAGQHLPGCARPGTGAKRAPFLPVCG